MDSKDDDSAAAVAPPTAQPAVDMSGLNAIAAGLPRLPAWMLSASAELSLAGGEAAGTGGASSTAAVAGTPSTAASATSGFIVSAATAACPPTVPEPSSFTDNDDERSLPIAGRCDDDPHAAAVRARFRINEFLMRDGVSGRVLWRATNVDNGSLFSSEVEAHLPASTLQCAAVTRQFSFSSGELMRDFFMVQRVFLGADVVESHEFTFGFVIPGSTNTWEQVVEADPEGVLPAEVLSGNLRVETRFYDKSTLITTAVIRVFYDA